MKPNRSISAVLLSAISLVLVAVAWVLFAPAALGGQASYVILNGNSMEPGMSRGDLAIVRANQTYEVGDVVTYRHPQIGPIIHRIVGIENGRFVLQGDNNDFLDGHEPVPDEVIGKLWIHVPNVGAWMMRFNSPWYLTGLLAFAFVGMGGAKAKQVSGSQRSGRPSTPRADERGQSPMKQLLHNWQDTISVLGVVGLALGILGWVAFNRPVMHDVPANIAYTQEASFDYSAASADGRVYDEGRAMAGEPVYRRLSEAVAFTFSWSLKTEGAAQVAGTHRLVAEIGDSNGWRRTIELSPETAFSGSEFLSAGVLNLREVEEHIAILEQQSGVKNDRYSVVIRPEVQASGTIAGALFEAQFATPLAMSMDAAQLRMERPAAESNPLAPKSTGNVNTLRTERNTVDVLMFSMPVSVARSVSLAGLGMVLAFTGWFVMVVVQERRPSRTPGGLTVPAKYRGPLVTVAMGPARRTDIVDVVSLDDLGRIAERTGGIVLQEARPGFHAFFVRDHAVTYRFQAVGSNAKGDSQRGAA
jgi:signal peptidase I